MVSNSLLALLLSRCWTWNNIVTFLCLSSLTCTIGRLTNCSAYFTGLVWGSSEKICVKDFALHKYSDLLDIFPHHSTVVQWNKNEDLNEFWNTKRSGQMTALHKCFVTMSLLEFLNSPLHQWPWARRLHQGGQGKWNAWLLSLPGAADILQWYLLSLGKGWIMQD